MELSDIKGIGPKNIKSLEQKNIETLEDLLAFYPINYTSYTSGETLKDKQNVKIRGKIIKGISEFRPRKNLLISTYFIQRGDQEYKIIAWNQHFLRFSLNVNDEIEIIGKYDQLKNQIVQTKYTIVNQNSLNEEQENSIIPIYSKVNGITNNKLNSFVVEAIKQLDESKYKASLQQLHNPESFKEIENAKQYLKYREFYIYYKKLRLLKDSKNVISKDYVKKIPFQNLEELFLDFKLPFELTKDQKEIIINNLNLLKSEKKMQKLILGDVGSGKTIVSIITAHMLVKSGYQVAVMAPTEVLAKQLFENFNTYLKEYNIELLIGSLKKNQKNQLKDRVLVGTSDIIIGTHALIQDDVVFKNLGLVIIDEQHKFGVEQRNNLINKSLYQEFMYLSATPIPRTLAQSIFNVVDIDFINSKPENRQKVETMLYTKKDRNKMFKHLEQEISLNNQAFIVAPTIEESEILGIENVENVYKNLKIYYKYYNIGLIHGSMKSQDKEIIMEKFKNHDYDILVATTVIEVGVDIPSATIMLVINAERYGLSQLHQLRGRVGRSSKKSYCLLYDLSNNRESTERLKILTEIDDGFELSQKDLNLRGSGDFFGKEQSGITGFKLFDYQYDIEIAQKVIKDVDKNQVLL